MRRELRRQVQSLLITPTLGTVLANVPGRVLPVTRPALLATCLSGGPRPAGHLTPPEDRSGRKHQFPQSRRAPLADHQHGPHRSCG